jgi:hypothetical protein
MGEVGFDTRGADVAGVSPPAGAMVEPDEVFDPIDIGLFGLVGVVADAEGVSELVEELHVVFLGRLAARRSRRLISCNCRRRLSAGPGPEQKTTNGAPS